jgi:hypothetical protein
MSPCSPWTRSAREILTNLYSRCRFGRIKGPAPLLAVGSKGAFLDCENPILLEIQDMSYCGGGGKLGDLCTS